MTSNDTQPNGNTNRPGSRLIEVAHEALIRDWPELREALEPKRAYLKWKQSIQAQLDQWDKTKISVNKQSPTQLLEGRELRQACQWLKDPALDFEDDLRVYVKTSQTQMRRRLTKRVALLVVCLAMTGAFVKTAWQYKSVPVARDLWLASIGFYWFLEPEMVTVPPNDTCPQAKACRFTMGDDHSDLDNEKPAHTVHFASNFKMGRYEVTFDEYDVFVELVNREGGCPYDKNIPTEQRKPLSRPKDESWGRGRQPVINVSHNDAQCYAQWLSDKTGENYHLPSEAQWEYAVRAGQQQVYFWGNDDPKKYAWFSDNSGQHAHPVGGTDIKPNSFGLYDMAGNVWEWTQDCLHSTYKDAPTTGEAWEEANNGNCTLRVLRGGSWISEAYFLRSAYRGRGDADVRDDSIGFRLAQD